MTNQIRAGEHLLPDFPTAKKRFGRDLKKFLGEQIRIRSAVTKVATLKRIFEGHRMESSVRDAEIDRDSTEFKEVQFSRNVDISRLIEDGVAYFVENVFEFIDKITAEQDRYILEKIVGICEQQNPDGDELTFESYLNVVENFPMGFDVNGEPRLQLMVPPSLERTALSWNKNPEYMRRYSELLERKRQEWLAKESHRRLED